MKKRGYVVLGVLLLFLTSCGGKAEQTAGPQESAETATSVVEKSPTDTAVGSTETEQIAERSGKENEAGMTTEVGESTVVEQGMLGENTMAESDETSETANNSDAESENPPFLQNEYFIVSLKSFDFDEEADSVVAVFAFTNITDEMYYKNDEEIQPGEGWEKTVTYTVSRWEESVGKQNWLHYDLYDDPEQEPFFSGGLCFTVGEDLQVTGMEIFTE